MDLAKSLASVVAGGPRIAAPERTPVPGSELEALLARQLTRLDAEALRREFLERGAFLYLEDFLPAELTAMLVAAAEAATPHVHRNRLPGHKQGGSVSRYRLDELAPQIGRLYRALALHPWLARIAGESLQASPEDDAHAYALYYYTRPGDFIGWHYDTSYYAGRRYTLLIGVLDESSCRLEYQLYTRVPGCTPVEGTLRIAPGGLVFFDGDQLRHRITPLGAGERRVTLTLEFVTDPRMHPVKRLISNFKDALGYFGFGDVFGRRRPAERA